MIITQPSIYGVIVYFCYVISHWTIPPVNKYDYRLALSHGLVTRFPLKSTQALIDMRDNDARTIRLWKETLCNNGENKVWFGNFKLQTGI